LGGRGSDFANSIFHLFLFSKQFPGGRQFPFPPHPCRLMRFFIEYAVPEFHLLFVAWLLLDWLLLDMPY